MNQDASATRSYRRTPQAITAAAAVLLIGAVSGCSSGSSPSSGPTVAGQKPYQMALITGDNHDPFFVSMNAGAQAEAAKLGVTVNWQGPAQYQAPLQIPIVSGVLTSKPDFAFICPTDAQALSAPIQELTSAGIPVMTLDSDITATAARLGNITSDNELGGKQAADTLAKAINNSGEVAVLNEQPGTSTTDLRQKGFEEEIAKIPGISYVGVGRDDDSPAGAAAAASALLARHPNLAGFFSTDTANGSGAATAVQQGGRPVKIVAFDAEPEEVNALKLGQIEALIVQKASDFGALAVQRAVKYLNGDHSAIPASDMQTYVIATAANINTPEVQKYLYVSQ